MPRFIIDFWLDGYDTEEEMEKACAEFIVEQLDMTASSVHIVDMIHDKDIPEDKK
jgi:hypothetical protein